MKATILVNKLLETERVCAACQKELGHQSKPDQSHGICKRHAIDYWTDVIGRERAVAKVSVKPDADFCPDLLGRTAAPPKASFYPSAGGPSSI